MILTGKITDLTNHINKVLKEYTKVTVLEFLKKELQKEEGFFLVFFFYIMMYMFVIYTLEKGKK